MKGRVRECPLEGMLLALGSEGGEEDLDKSWGVGRDGVPQVVGIAGARHSPRKILGIFRSHRLAVRLWQRAHVWKWWEVSSARVRSWEHFGVKLRSLNFNSLAAQVQREMDLSLSRARNNLAALALPSLHLVCLWWAPNTWLSWVTSAQTPTWPSGSATLPSTSVHWNVTLASVYIFLGGRGTCSCPTLLCPNRLLARTLEQEVGGAFKASVSGSFHCTTAASHDLLS